MIIHSLLGSFRVVADTQKSDRLLLQSKSKFVLNRMFDEKRIISNQSAEYEFFVELCKQEFAHTMISMIKEISYPEFDKELADLEIGREQVSA